MSPAHDEQAPPKRSCGLQPVSCLMTGQAKGAWSRAEDDVAAVRRSKPAALRSRASWTLLFVCLAVSPRPAVGEGSASAPVLRVPELPKKPSAPQRERIQAAYSRAATAYEQGDVKAALKAADEVFALLPNASTALLRADFLAELKRPCKAFEMYLVAYDLDPTDKERADVLKGLGGSGAACKPGYGWALVDVTPESASVQLAQTAVPVGRTVGIAAGARAITAEAPGHASLRAGILVHAGKPALASFDLAPVTREAISPAPAPKPPPEDLPSAVVEEPARSSPGNALAWVLLGTGGAAAGAGVALHMAAMSSADDADRYRVRPEDGVIDGIYLTEAERARRYEGAESDATLRRILAFSAYGLGAGLVTTGAVMLLSGSKDDPEPASFRISPLALPGARGLLIQGRF